MLIHARLRARACAHGAGHRVRKVAPPARSGLPAATLAAATGFRRASLRTGLVLLSLLVLAVSAWLTGTVRRLALSHGLVDVPNSRSSHTRTTPRGGGLAVVLSSLPGLTLLYAAGLISSALLLAVAVGGGAVALIGFLDDRYSVHPWVRVAVHVAAALWALSCFGG